MPARRPNVLVFMTDQQRGDVVMPKHPCQLPHAARLAGEGIRFTHAFTCTAHCCPSRATFMTGAYPSRHGIYNNVSTPTAIHRGLYPNVPMFSERLRDSGYRLSYSGKWHVSDEENPSDRGWTELQVGASKGSFMHRRLDHWREMAQKAKAQPAPLERPWGVVQRPGWGDIEIFGSRPVPPELKDRPWESHHDWRTVKQGLDALPGLAASGEPWFLYVGCNGPHDPFVIPEPYAKLYDPLKIPLPPNYRDTLEDKPRIYQRMRKQYWDQLSEDEIRASIAHYWGYCKLEDDYLGLLLDALEKTGQADNTLVIFTSDHGEYLGAHGLYAKGVPCFREAYHVPLLVRWPEGIHRPGREVDEFITLADFAPTFTELAGANSLGEITGRSFVPFLRNETPADWPQEHYTQFNGVELYYTQRSVSTKAHKYVYNGFDFDELYDLQKDPHETRNVASDPAYTAIKRDLCGKMWRFAERERDEMLFNPYWTVAMAPYGPADALG
ncbi:MAG: sulfatase-like hydrolase/transferase [Planctomycetes bacterium]|nr:sulfatase-like hydrolase/transferase [Planctomycetota bacterium]